MVVLLVGGVQMCITFRQFSGNALLHQYNTKNRHDCNKIDKVCLCKKREFINLTAVYKLRTELISSLPLSPSARQSFEIF